MGSLGYTAMIDCLIWEQNPKTKQSKKINGVKVLEELAMRANGSFQRLCLKSEPGWGNLSQQQSIYWVCIRPWSSCPARIPCTHPWNLIQYVLCLDKSQLPMYAVETVHSSWKDAQKNWPPNSLWDFPKKQWDTNCMSKPWSMNQGLVRSGVPLGWTSVTQCAQQVSSVVALRAWKLSFRSERPIFSFLYISPFGFIKRL